MDSGSRPVESVVIRGCGQLVQKESKVDGKESSKKESSGKKRKGGGRRSGSGSGSGSELESSSSSSSSGSESSGGSSASESSEDDEAEGKQRQKKSKKAAGDKKSSDSRSGKQAKDKAYVTQESGVVIVPDEIPEVPMNKFLMRGTPQIVPDDFRRRDNRSRQRKPLTTKSGRKCRGRGAMRYRTPSASGSDRSRSRTPPHWRKAQMRLVSILLVPVAQ